MIEDTYRIKKTKKIVYPMQTGHTHTLCLFPFGFTSKNGFRGVIQPVKNENLIRDKESI